MYSALFCALICINYRNKGCYMIGINSAIGPKVFLMYHVLATREFAMFVWRFNAFS